jgi:hypothetical protein
MKLVRIGASLISMLAFLAMPAAAQDTRKPLPDTTKCPEAIANEATCYSAKLASGAYLLAAMPRNWNGNLIVFAHGGPHIVAPTAITSQTDLDKYGIGVKLGFAWIASTYRREGYGVQMAADDTDDARKFFIERFATPKRTILHGASYGGLVGAKLLETRAVGATGALIYDGAMLNSGAMGGALPNYEFRADLRVVYQYYCKNLPRSDEPQYPLWMGLPADSKMTLKEIAARVDECTGVTQPAATRTGTQKQNMANILGVIRIPENMLVRHMQAATFVLRDLAQGIGRGRGVFSNRNVRYQGSTDDAALNRDVERFDADAAALAAITADGQPTGALPVPVVSIHSMNDPQAAVEAQYEYRARVQAAGNGVRLVQAYTDEPAHTAQSAAELAAAFDALMQWIEKGVKPAPSSIAAACTRLSASHAGPCRYRTDYEPKPYHTRFARSTAAR